MRFFRFPTAMVRPLSSLAKFSFVISSAPFPREVLRRSSGIVFLSEVQKLQKFSECDFASRKGDLLRLKRTIPHPGRERFTLAANLPFPSPSWLNHPPRSVGDDLSNTDTFVPERRRKLIPIWIRASRDDGHGSLNPGLRYRTGSGCGFGAVLGDFSGGAGTAGSRVGD